MVFNRFHTLYSMIRKKMPTVPIAYISIKPSPAREHYFPISKKANLLIRNFLSTQPNTQFIDVFPLMLTADDHPTPDLFVEDRLHMNQKGYAIWAKAIEPYLLKQDR